MNRKLKNTLLASTIALVLAGCSSDDTETPTTPTTPVVNATPVLTLVSGSELTLEENNSATIEYNIADNDHSESELTVSLETSGLTDPDIVVSLNEADKTVTVESGNVQDLQTFSVNLTVEDPEGASQTQTVVVSVQNTENESPSFSFVGYSIEEDRVEVQVAGTNSPELDYHEVQIPFQTTDNDGDALDLSISELNTLQNPSISIDAGEDNSGVINLSFDKIYQSGGDGSNVGEFTITANDQNDPKTITFNLTVGITQVSPELTIQKNEVAGGVIPFEVDENSNISIRYTTNDLNGDQVFISAELSDPDVIPDFETDVSGGSIDLTNFNVSEDTLLTLTLTATDNTGTPVVTDSVQVNITDTVNQSLKSLNTQIDAEKVKFVSMNSRNPESTLFAFYTDYLSLTEQLTDNQKASYQTQMENGRLAEIDAAEVLISDLDEERAKSEDEIDLTLLQTKLDELKVANNAIGLSGVAILNQLTQIDSSLLTIDNVSNVYQASDESYSRYIGNPDLGFYSNEFTWEFLSAYDLLENVNFQTGECN